MPRSGRLRLKDQRAAYRLIGECRDLADDPVAWRAHMLAGLCRLLGARLGLGMTIRGVLTAGEAIEAPLDTGFADSAERALWIHYQQEGAQRHDPFHPRYFDGFTGPLRTRSRAAVVESTLWYRSSHYHHYLRACRLDDRATSSFRLGEGASAPLHVVVLHRAAGDGAYTARDVRLLHLFHHELGPMIGRQLAAPEAAAVPSLPPRLRQVLACLLLGDGEKQAAQRLGLSRHTVNRHIQRLHKAFGVQSRGQLLFHCRDMLPALRAELPEADRARAEGP